MPPAVLVGADAERAFQEMTGQSSGSAATTIAAKAALHDRNMTTFEHPPAPDRNTGGIPTKDEKGNILAPPAPPRPPAPPAPSTPPASSEPSIPEKFKGKSTEEVIRAYQELERKLGAPPQQQPPAQDPPEAAPQGVAEGEDDDDPVLPAFASAEDEARFTESVISAVGGQEVFESLAAWAPEYGDPVTVNAFNEAVNSGNANGALLAVKALRYEMTQRQGYTPTLVGGLAMGSQSGPQPFSSNAELRAAMRDPRYMPGPRQDGAYVEEIQSRLAVSFR